MRFAHPGSSGTTLEARGCFFCEESLEQDPQQVIQRKGLDNHLEMRHEWSLGVKAGGTEPLSPAWRKAVAYRATKRKRKRSASSKKSLGSGVVPPLPLHGGAAISRRKGSLWPVSPTWPGRRAPYSTFLADGAKSAPNHFRGCPRPAVLQFILIKKPECGGAWGLPPGPPPRVSSPRAQGLLSLSVNCFLLFSSNC